MSSTTLPTAEWELLKSGRMHELYRDLLPVLGNDFRYERFTEWANQYCRDSREYHGLNHMLDMSVFNTELSPRSAAKEEMSAASISMVAGFFHDEDYPSIVEETTSVSKHYIDKYVEAKDGKKFLKPLAPNDKTMRVVQDIFGFKDSQELSPFAGMNEYYCAIAAACELKELGKSDQFIAGVAAAIQATIAFNGPNRPADGGKNRMDKLRERLEATNTTHSLNLSKHDIDEMMIGATHLANRDVSSFLGGLNPLDAAAKPTKQSVLNTIRDGDMLNAEEIPQLRITRTMVDKSPGNYSPRHFLDARLKRAGLYQLVIPGNADAGTIPNLFYDTKLSDGTTYPPEDWAEKANKLAFANNVPVRAAQYARLVSAGIVHSLAHLSTHLREQEPSVTVHNLLGKLPEIMRECQLPPGSTEQRELAFCCVNGRDEGALHDIRRSAISEFILSKLDIPAIETLGKASRDLLFFKKDEPSLSKELADKLNAQFPSGSRPPLFKEGENKEEAFLKLSAEFLGQGVDKIRGDVVRSAQQSKVLNAVAAAMGKLTIPTGPTVG